MPSRGGSGKTSEIARPWLLLDHCWLFSGQGRIEAPLKLQWSISAIQNSLAVLIIQCQTSQTCHGVSAQLLGAFNMITKLLPHAAGAQEGAPALNSASAGALQAAAADLRRVSFAGDSAGL